MDNYTDEELCSTLRENNGLINCQAQIQAADRIEELLETVKRLNNTIISITEPYSFYPPCINNSEENVTKILKE